MTIRTILAAASGGSATAGTLDLACQLARRFEAHLRGYHVVPDPRALFAAAGDIAAPGSAALVEGLMDEARAKADRARATFDEIVTHHGLPRVSVPQPAAVLPSASWREDSGGAPALVARQARFFDLVVLGRSERVVAEPHTDTIEEVLLHAGRPVLLAPATAPGGIGYVVAAAWNGSAEAVRAMTAALPFFEHANKVALIAAGDSDTESSRLAVDYLGWHGIKAELHRVERASGRRVGRTLFETAQDWGADLLVMGAYGRAPWREQVFGGATQTALASMPLPVLLMH